MYCIRHDFFAVFFEYNEKKLAARKQIIFVLRSRVSKLSKEEKKEMGLNRNQNARVHYSQSHDPNTHIAEKEFQLKSHFFLVFVFPKHAANQTQPRISTI